MCVCVTGFQNICIGVCWLYVIPLPTNCTRLHNTVVLIARQSSWLAQETQYRFCEPESD